MDPADVVDEADAERIDLGDKQGIANFFVTHIKFQLF